MALLVILSTAPSPEKAAEIAKTLIEEKLAACVNILPGARSIYKWQGKICDEPETLLFIKSDESLLDKLETRFLAIHPYDTPEFVVVEPGHVTEKYKKWLNDTLS